jgi:hypothetical protein
MENNYNVSGVIMERYDELKKLMAFLQYGMDFDMGGYQRHMQFFLETNHKSTVQEYLSTIRSQVEAAMSDPDFDWFEVGVQTEFVEALEGDPTWPFKKSADVLYYFQLLTFDILYPERALSLAEQELLRRTVLYLLLDILEEKGRVWIPLEALLKQLRNMKLFWRQLEDYHLYCLHNYFFELKGGYSSRISQLQLCERDHRPYLDVLKQCIKAGYEPFSHIPDYKWPPFDTTEKTAESLNYSKPEWFKIVNSYSTLPDVPPDDVPPSQSAS